MPNGNSPSIEQGQTPASATSKRGLGKEAQDALLRVRTMDRGAWWATVHVVKKSRT